MLERVFCQSHTFLSPHHQHNQHNHKQNTIITGCSFGQLLVENKNKSPKKMIGSFDFLSIKKNWRPLLLLLWLAAPEVANRLINGYAQILLQKVSKSVTKNGERSKERTLLKNFFKYEGNKITVKQAGNQHA